MIKTPALVFYAHCADLVSVCTAAAANKLVLRSKSNGSYTASNIKSLI